MQTKLLNPAWWVFLPARTAAFKRAASKRVGQILAFRELARFPILRRVAITTTFSLLLLVGNIEAIDWDLRPAGRDVVGGAVSDMVVVGSHAYAVSGDGFSGLSGLGVFDLSDAANPRLVGDYRTWERATGVAVTQGYAYVVGSGKLEVFDLSNPVIPRWRGGCDIPGEVAIRVAVSGHYAYVASGNAGLQVVDVSNPANPRPVRGYSVRRFADAVAVSDNHAYVISSRFPSAVTPPGGWLSVFDLRDPTIPKPPGIYETRSAISGLAVSGAYAYLAEAEARSPEGELLVSAGFRVIDIRDPANPKLAGGYNSSHSLGRVVVSGNYAYAVDEGDGLTVIDIRNPMNPQPVGEYTIQGFRPGVAVSGNHLYVGTRAGFEVLDITTPANPRPVGAFGAGPFLHRLVTSGAYGYALVGGCHPAACGGGGGQMAVIDFSKSANSTARGAYHSWGLIYGLAVSGAYAYLAEGSRWDGTNEVIGRLSIVDIRNPDQPAFVGAYQTGRPLSAVAVSGGYACVLGEQLQVFDVSDPANPRPLGSYQEYCRDTVGVVLTSHAVATPSPQGVGPPGDTLFAMSGRYAYVGRGNTGLCVIDITNPASPRWVTTYKMEDQQNQGITDFALAGDYAFLSGYDTLEVLDIRNPANPQRIAAIAASVYPGGMAVSGDRLCYFSSEYGLQLIDLADVGIPPTATGLGANGSAGRVALSGNNVFLVERSGVQVLALTPANPQRVSELALPDTPFGAVAVSGNFAYAGDWEGGLDVVDISNPEKAQRVGRYEADTGSVIDMAVSGNYAYLAELPRSIPGRGNVGGGLRVIDVKDPVSPQQVGLAHPRSSFVGVGVSGNYAYVASDGGASQPGLLVIDISDPANPHRVASLPASRAFGVMVSGSYAYLTRENGGLDVIDISDPLRPQRLGRFNANRPGAAVYDFALDGTYAYMTIETLGLQVIDISDPANPQRVARDETGDVAIRVAVVGDYAYVTRNSGHIEVLDISTPTQPRLVGSNRSFSVRDMAISGAYIVATKGSDAGGELVILDLFRALRLQPVEWIGPDTLRLAVDGPRGASAWVQRSTDLTNWDDWRVITFGAAATEVSDIEADTGSHYFYRSVMR